MTDYIALVIMSLVLALEMASYIKLKRTQIRMENMIVEQDLHNRLAELYAERAETLSSEGKAVIEARIDEVNKMRELFIKRMEKFANE